MKVECDMRAAIEEAVEWETLPCPLAVGIENLHLPIAIWAHTDNDFIWSSFLEAK